MHSREILEAIQQALYRAGAILEAAAQPGKPSRIDAQQITGWGDRKGMTNRGDPRGCRGWRSQGETIEANRMTNRDRGPAGEILEAQMMHPEAPLYAL